MGNLGNGPWPMVAHFGAMGILGGPCAMAVCVCVCVCVCVGVGGWACAAGATQDPGPESLIRAYVSSANGASGGK
jgi:hypothetical protein